MFHQTQSVVLLLLILIPSDPSTYIPIQHIIILVSMISTNTSTLFNEKEGRTSINTRINITKLNYSGLLGSGINDGSK